MRRPVGLACLVGLLAACSGLRTVVQGQQGMFAPTALAVGGGFVYWADYYNGKIGRVSVGGGANTVLATGQAMPSSIAVDDANIYWTNSGDDAQTNCGGAPRCFTSNGGVFAMPLAGGTPIALSTGLCGADSLALDATNVYVAVSGNGSVLSIPKGGGQPFFYTVSEFGLGSVAVDAHDVYWTSLSMDWMNVTVSKSPIGVSSPSQITPPLPAIPGSSGCGNSVPALAVDSNAVYWSTWTAWSTTPGTGDLPLLLMKAPLNGGAPSQLAQMALINTNGFRGAFTVDSSNAYWYDSSAAELREAPLAGGDATALGTPDGQEADALAAVQSTLFWADTFGGRIGAVATH